MQNQITKHEKLKHDQVVLHIHPSNQLLSQY